MQPDGRAWLYAPGGTKDGPLPAHYEPAESPVANVLYHRTRGPVRHAYMESQLNPVAHPPSPEFPVVACTFRVTEHYLSGPMSRFNSWLNELMPAMFVEISPELAGEHGIENGGWMSVTSARGTISARALVTRRQKPMTVLGQLIHQIGIPFHWGYAGETVGGQSPTTSRPWSPTRTSRCTRPRSSPAASHRACQKAPRPSPPCPTSRGLTARTCRRRRNRRSRKGICIRAYNWN